MVPKEKASFSVAG